MLKWHQCRRTLCTEAHMMCEYEQRRRDVIGKSSLVLFADQLWIPSDYRIVADQRKVISYNAKASTRTVLIIIDNVKAA